MSEISVSVTNNDYFCAWGTGLSFALRCFKHSFTSSLTKTPRFCGKGTLNISLAGLTQQVFGH